MTIDTINGIVEFKQKAHYWAHQKNTTVVYLDSNNNPNDAFSNYECLLAVGIHAHCLPTEHKFGALEAFAQQYKGEWLFGYLAYDLKNELEELSSSNKDAIGLPDLYFFVPQYVIAIDKNKSLSIFSKKESEQEVLAAIQQTIIPTPTPFSPIHLTPSISKKDYMATVEKIQQHIVDGDVYEINFCQEFGAKTAIQPLTLFHQLNQRAQAPFAAYIDIGTHQLLCASPERFLCKRGQKVISQPIKGTRPRGKNQAEDEILKQALLQSEKDRAENVMIVDLVRNDLTKTAQTGTIKVEELFGIYSFENVHQMISTISAIPKEKVSWVEIIRQAFPMGSMTGAPKVMSMQLIEQYEQTKRGLYAGAVGYVSPNQDFDFNVVIRSILYNTTSNYLSVQVGGAIVYDSVATEEYEECLHKVKNILEVLGGKIPTPSFLD